MIKRLSIEEKKIILVGTAHISKESIDLVEKTIEEEQPDVIGVELDRERLEQLMSGKKWQETNMVEIVKTGRTYLFLLNVLLANMQKQIGQKIGIQPGAEMLAALKKAQEKKTPVQLLDRDVRVTLKRTFDSMGLIEKMKLGGSIIGGFLGFGEKVDAQKIEELKQQDLINALMKELGKQFPSVKRVLVDERDTYIAEMVRNSPGTKIVAIVGAGHIEGIEAYLKQNKKADITELNQVVKKKNYLKYAAWIIPALFVVLLGFALWNKGVGAVSSVLFYWILTTGSLAALGALISRAHPITIITSFVVAPLTTLSPALAAGWFAAISEARFNPPKVKDFEELSNVSSIKGFYKNNITHILIVAALVNLGATIGSLLALPLILSLL